MYNNINSFFIKDDVVLFFDIFVKNNQLHMILPCPLDEPANADNVIDNIEIYFDKKLLKIHFRFVEFTFEQHCLVIYEPFEETRPVYEISVKYNSLEIQKYKLYPCTEITKKYTLTHSTMCKNDYEFFYPFYHYYRSQGVEFFIIYYNSKLNEKIINFFSQFDNRVLVVEWNFTFRQKTKYYPNGMHYAQPSQVTHVLHKYAKQLTTYHLYCDLDEYLKNTNDSLINYLKKNTHLNAIYFRNTWADVVNESEMNPHILMHNKLIKTGIPSTTKYRCKQIVKVDKIIDTSIHTVYDSSLPHQIFTEDNIMYHFYKMSNTKKRNITEKINNHILL